MVSEMKFSFAVLLLALGIVSLEAAAIHGKTATCEGVNCEESHECRIFHPWCEGGLCEEARCMYVGKPGKCPFPANLIANGIDSCHSDNDCPGKRKCCPLMFNSGNVCFAPSS
ncbi:uncharacterized protein LOC141910106 [Tubulanus polymorphus]|uniref:uncharacterized protein LOC141910106 n=1 Tax=Tubulanus polymorphus TaxID=672921 RepID=UPI003DA64DE2